MARYRKIHLRLTLENNSHDSGIVTYTFDEVVEYFKSKYDDGPSEIVIALHNKDAGKAHVHILGCYDGGGDTSFNFDVIKKRFPQIHKCENPSHKESMFAYAIHANDPNKAQYSVDDLAFVGEISKEIYEEYVSISKNAIAESNAKKEAEKAAKVAQKSVKEKYNALNLDMIVQKAADAEEAKQLEAFYRTVRDQIWDGTLTRRKYNSLLKSDTVYRDMHDKYKSRIYDTFERRRAWMVEHYKDRALKVIFIEGNGSGGKTELAKAICDKMNWSYSVSSEKNDIFENVLEDDDVFIFNEVTDSMCEYRTFNRWLDPYVNPSLGSRFHKKNFFGHTIIITTPKTIDQWYTGKGMADGDYEGQSTRVQFDRRIHKLIKVRGDFVEEYIHNED